MKYKNIDERWGDAVEITVQDYHDVAKYFDRTVEVEERDDGLYINGKQVARVIIHQPLPLPHDCPLCRYMEEDHGDQDEGAQE